MEKLKQEHLEEMGFTVVRLTWRQVTERPEESAARIRRAFARGAARIDGAV
jgi:very-short-patch-repair endonuclease